MIGVILWSDPEDQKAVIWCEDHGDLAFLSQPSASTSDTRFVDVGDVVEFDLCAGQHTRRVGSVRVLSSSGGNKLIDDLRAAGEPGATTAQIIPFCVDGARRKEPQYSERVQRQG